MFIHSALNYTGGKYKIIDYLIKLFPNNIDNFVDLFCGGLNVSLNVLLNLNVNKVYANDSMRQLIDIYKTI